MTGPPDLSTGAGVHPHVGKSPPTDVKARDDSPPTPSSAEPYRHDVPIGTPPRAMEGFRSTSVDLSPSTTMPGTPPAMSPSVRPTPDSITRVADAMGRANTSSITMIAPDCDLPITVTATSTYVGRVMTDCVAPTMVGAMSAEGSSVCPVVGSGITSIAGYLATFEGVPRASTSSCPTEGMGAIMGSA
ncbi:uncharacterized protein [Miscanthus floridulus]|uniref:uncharacterized protein n=1 Tax=Miscanthus floridulus TaxID=154761 RepID=UPI00345931E3